MKSSRLVDFYFYILEKYRNNQATIDKLMSSMDSEIREIDCQHGKTKYNIFDVFSRLNTGVRKRIKLTKAFAEELNYHVTDFSAEDYDGYPTFNANNTWIGVDSQSERVSQLAELIIRNKNKVDDADLEDMFKLMYEGKEDNRQIRGLRKHVYSTILLFYFFPENICPLDTHSRKLLGRLFGYTEKLFEKNIKELHGLEKEIVRKIYASNYTSISEFSSIAYTGYNSDSQNREIEEEVDKRPILVSFGIGGSNSDDIDKNTQGQRSGSESTIVDYVHKEVQRVCSEELSKSPVIKTVDIEMKISYSTPKISTKSIDMYAETYVGERIFFEIKINGNALKSIRSAIGQLMEYSYFIHESPASKLVIVSIYSLTNEEYEYLEKLRNNFKIPIYYLKYDQDNEELIDLDSIFS